ncbi:hypothetical protein ScPMuIL_008349 [Solemya velum]
MESVVNGSASVNIAQLVGREDGTSLNPVRDWQSHLGKILKVIKQYHHFRFDSAEPGMVFAREVADSPEETAFRLFSVPADLPRDPSADIPPPGLDLQRQSYLFNNIRQKHHVLSPCNSTGDQSGSASGTW